MNEQKVDLVLRYYTAIAISKWLNELRQESGKNESKNWH